MKKRIIIPILLFIAVIGTSCVSQHNVERNYSELRPDMVRLYMTMDDYQYLGDVTIDIEYKTYLGIFRKILTVNGQPYDPRFYHNTKISFTHKIKLGLLKKSLYKVAETYPEADDAGIVQRHRGAYAGRSYPQADHDHQGLCGEQSVC